MKLRRLFFRIKRLWEFIRLGWNDFDWDYVYILYLIEFKLEKMIVHIERNARHQDYQLTVKQMKVAKALLDRIINPPYYEMLRKSEYCTCPEFCMTFQENGEVKFNFCKHCSDVKAIRSIHNLKQRDWDMFFDHCKKHMQKWWD